MDINMELFLIIIGAIASIITIVGFFRKSKIPNEHVSENKVTQNRNNTDGGDVVAGNKTETHYHNDTDRGDTNNGTIAVINNHYYGSKNNDDTRDSIIEKEENERKNNREYRENTITPPMKELKEIRDKVRLNRIEMLKKEGSINMEGENNINILNDIIKTLDTYTTMTPILLNFAMSIPPPQLTIYNKIQTIIITITSIFPVVVQKETMNNKDEGKLYLILYGYLSKLIGLTERCVDVLDSTIIYRTLYDTEQDLKILKALDKMLNDELQPILHELSITQEDLDNLLKDPNDSI